MCYLYKILKLNFSINVHVFIIFLLLTKVSIIVGLIKVFNIVGLTKMASLKYSLYVGGQN